MLRWPSVAVLAPLTACVEVPASPFAANDCVEEACRFPPQNAYWNPESDIQITALEVIGSSEGSYSVIAANAPNNGSRAGLFYRQDQRIDSAPEYNFVPTEVRPDTVFWDSAYGVMAIAGRLAGTPNEDAHVSLCAPIDGSITCSPPALVSEGLRGADIRDLVTGDFNQGGQQTPPDVVVVGTAQDPLLIRECTDGVCDDQFRDFGSLLGPPNDPGTPPSRIRAVDRMTTVVTSSGAAQPRASHDLIVLERPSSQDRVQWFSYLQTESPNTFTGYQPIAIPRDLTDTMLLGFQPAELGADELNSNPRELIGFGPSGVLGVEVDNGLPGGDAPLTIIAGREAPWSEALGNNPLEVIAVATELIVGNSLTEIGFLLDSGFVLAAIEGQIAGNLLTGARVGPVPIAGNTPVDIAATTTHFLAVTEDATLTCIEVTSGELLIDSDCSSL